MKTHRLYLTALLVLFCTMMGFAQEVTLDFTQTWESVKTNVYSLNGYTITLKNGKFSDVSGYHYLILKGKDATLTLPAFDFDVEKIEVVGRSVASSYVTQNVFVKSVAVSTETTGAKTTNTYEIAEGYQTAGTVYIIKVTNSENSQMDAVRIYKKGGSTVTKTATTTSFASDAVTVEEGGTYAGQQATVTPTDVTGTLTYVSSNENVATVDASTGAVTLVDGGTTTITATFTPDDAENYKGSSASYTLVYNKRKTTTLAFAKQSDTANLNLAYQLPALTLTAGSTKLTSKTFTYASSDESVATIDAEGTVTLKSLGSTTITASFAGDESYLPSSATLALAVAYATTDTVTFDASKSSDKTSELSITKGHVTMAHTINKGNFNLKDGEYSIYSSSPVTFSTDEGYITMIEIEASKQGQNFYLSGDGYKANSSKSKGTWTGRAKSVTLTNTDSQRALYSKATVYVSYVEDLTLSENTANENTIASAMHKVSNVTIDRTLTADGGWYTLCLPFSVDATGVSDALKGAELMEFDAMQDDGKVMLFKAATSIEAGRAYLVLPKSGNNIEKPVFKEVVVSAESPLKPSGDYAFVGIYSPTTLATDGTNLFLGADNNIYKPTASGNQLKGLRAYIVVPQEADAAKMSIDVGGEMMSISNVHDAVPTDAKVYNLQGQMVGRSTDRLARGFYIVNGRKMIVR